MLPRSPFNAENVTPKVSSKHYRTERSTVWACLIGHTYPVAVNHFAALPAGEYQHKHHYGRKHHAGRDYGGAAILVPPVPVEQCDEQSDGVTNGMKPRIRYVAHPIIAEQLHKARRGAIAAVMRPMPSSQREAVAQNSFDVE